MKPLNAFRFIKILNDMHNTIRKQTQSLLSKDARLGERIDDHGIFPEIHYTLDFDVQGVQLRIGEFSLKNAALLLPTILAKCPIDKHTAFRIGYIIND